MAKKIEQTTGSPDRATAYAEAVVAGRIIAGPHVRNACQRHLNDLGREDVSFDVVAAERVFGFYEKKLRLSEGQFEDQPFMLEPSQCFIVGSIMGWKKPSGLRRFRRAYIEIGKGNGKSPLAGGIGLYGLTYDDEAGAEIYSAGATKDQAGILFRDAVKMRDKSPEISKRVKASGGPGREYNLAYLKNASFFRPVSRETKRTGSGPRPHFALVDELHEHPDRGVVDMLERGFKFRRQPLLVMITNSGTDRNSVCWEEHEHACKVASGEVEDDDTFSFVCGLDKDDDPLADPSCWIKANPLLGITITEEYLAGVVKQARALPGKLNGILRLHFCVWTDAEEAWMSRQTLESVLYAFEPMSEHAGKRVAVSLDLSATTDLTSAGFCVETGEVERTDESGGKILLPTYDAWVETWTPADTLPERALRDKAPYDVWAREGYLHTTPGKIIRLDFIAARIAGIATELIIYVLAYDQYAFRKFEDACNDLGLTLNFVWHPQGGMRRARPTDEQIEAAKDNDQEPEGLWMPGSVKEVEALIYDGRIRFRQDPVFISAAMSVVMESDAFNNRWPSKRKATNRIDPMVAAFMAIGAATQTTHPARELEIAAMVA